MSDDFQAIAARCFLLRNLEEAVHHLLDTDLQLRSSSRAPQMALIERALIRLAMMPRGSR